MKIFCIFIYCLLSLSYFSSSIHLECSYSTWPYDAIGSIYFCGIQNNLNILSIDSAFINRAIGDLSSYKSIDQVLGIGVMFNTIHFFPRGLHNVFKRLKMIEFKNCGLLEIHQSDLMHLTRLEYLDLESNEVEVIEDGLFDYNPSMRFISISSNKIIEVHPEVFDHLTKLMYLYLERNKCINMNARNNPSGVKDVIKQVKLKCPSPGNLNSRQSSPKDEARLMRMSLKLENFGSDLRNCQNSIFGLTQELSRLEKSSQALNEETLKKLQNVESSLKASSSENLQRIQNLDNKASSLEKTIQGLNIKSIENKTTIIEKNIESLKAFDAETSQKLQTLEKALNTTDEDLKSFRTEVLSALQNILDKVEENSEKFERKSMEKIEIMSTSIKASQTQAFVEINDKIRNISADMSALQTTLVEAHKGPDTTCDAEQADDKLED